VEPVAVDIQPEVEKQMKHTHALKVYNIEPGISRGECVCRVVKFFTTEFVNGEPAKEYAGRIRELDAGVQENNDRILAEIEEKEKMAEENTFAIKWDEITEERKLEITQEAVKLGYGGFNKVSKKYGIEKDVLRSWWASYRNRIHKIKQIADGKPLAGRTDEKKPESIQDRIRYLEGWQAGAMYVLGHKDSPAEV